MKQTILTLAAIFGFLTVNAYSAPIHDNTGKIEPVVKIKTETYQKQAKTASIKVKPVTVKNIWKDMPGYDRFGNKMTPKVRETIRNNSALKNKAK